MWTYFFVIIICLKNSTCYNDFFVVHKHEDAKYYCKTNSSFALSWIPKETSSEIELQESRFWNVTCDETEKSTWQCQKSISSEIILDRRWEPMKIYKSDSSDNYSPLVYTTVAEELETNFDVPLSIRIEQEAHIFLCDGNSVPHSNCYWLILQGFGGQKSLVRRCAIGTIPSINMKPKCNETKTIRINSAKYLTNQKWNHFQLSKRKNLITLTSSDGTNILSYTDNEDPFQVTHMMIHSKKGTGFWKIHQVEYFHTQKARRTQFETPLSPAGGSLCVSMFVKMCKFCKIQLEIRSKDNQKEILGQNTYTNMSGWTEITMMEDNVDKEVLLSLTTISEIGTDPFWALDDIRQCHRGGLRMIRSNEPANCQLVSNDTQIISHHQVNTTIELNQCVTKSCIPCSWFMDGKCKTSKICQLYQNKTTCCCSAGYQVNTTSNDCDSPCDSGKYGLQCKNVCEENCQNCDNVDGTCGTCRQNYTGAKCEIPPLPFFKNAPTIKSLNYTEVTIHIKNFEISESSGLSYNYTIQYKKAQDEGLSWSTVEPTYRIEDGAKYVTIKNLEPGTNYLVRCVITMGKIYSDARAAHTEFTTKCDGIIENVKIGNTSAVLAFMTEAQDKICRFNRTKIKIETDNGKIFSYYVTPNNIFLADLTPYEQYEFTISTDGDTIRKAFKTTEGIPEKIQNLRPIYASDSSVQLKWEKPAQIFGDLLNYVVTYKILSFKGCTGNKSANFPPQETKATNTSIIVSNLTPYAKYAFWVSAQNSKFQGASATTVADTHPSDTIHDDEIPNLESMTTKSRSVNLEFSHISCDKMRGPLHVLITATCSHEWCKDVQDGFVYGTTQSHQLYGLFPYTEYTLKFEFCQSSTFCSKSLKFRTQPESPYSVMDLLVYAKNNDSVSVRWKPPYPPTGILELYQISYYGLGEKANLKNVTNSPCTLWPEYQCVTLENLKESTEYSVELCAKNESPDIFGQLKTVKTLTKTEPSQEPPALATSWTLENDLEVTWEHPSEANGDVQNFNISVLPEVLSPYKNIHDVVLVTKGKYMPAYRHLIKAKDLLTLTKYRILVRAYNGLDGYESYKEDISPPEIPSFEEEPKIQVSNSTIEVETSKIKNLNNKNNYTLFLLLLKDKITVKSHPMELKQFETKFRRNLSQFSVIYECGQYTNSENFTIGQNNQVNKCKRSSNASLSPGTPYNVTILLVNTVENRTSYKLYSYDLRTLNLDENSNVYFIILWVAIATIATIAAIVVTYLTYRSLKKKALRAADITESHKLVSYVNTEPFRDLHDGDGRNKEKEIYSKPILVKKFNDYVKQQVQSGELKHQHEAILQNIHKGYEEIKNSLFFEYIDIYFPSGHHIPKVYIVSKVPKLNQADEFWNLVWKENVEHIVLLDNYLEQKLTKNYWPKHNETLSNQNISVHCLSEDFFVNHEHRKFTLTYNNQTRVVHQLRFTSWLDYDLPHSLTFVPFFQKMSKISLKSKSPILVHCRTGLRGTGFAVLCDTSLRTAEKDGILDVFKNSRRLSDCASDLNDNYECYQLAHLVILETLLASDVAINLEKDKELRKCINYMADTLWIDQIASGKKRESNVYFRAVTPLYEGEILLAPYSPDGETDSYLTTLNGVVIDDNTCPKKIIMAQQPLSDHFEEFWKLVTKMNVSVIISLNQIVPPHKNFWSHEDKLSKNGIVKIQNIKELKGYDWITVDLNVEKHKEKKSVNIFSMKNWYSGNVCPGTVSDFVQFCIESCNMTKKSETVLVTCHDGATASGLYVAMFCVTEKITKENTWDFCSSVRMVRRHRPQFGEKDKQMAFLWEASEYYVKQSQLYEIC